jgi:hypothetical protein
MSILIDTFNNCNLTAKAGELEQPSVRPERLNAFDDGDVPKGVKPSEQSSGYGPGQVRGGGGG